MPGKRKRGSYKTRPSPGYSTSRGMRRIVKTARKNKWAIGTQARVARLERMIETKEGSIQTDNNVPLYHNNVRIVQNSTAAEFNLLFTQTGTTDPMGPNDARRIGDKIAVRGVMIKGFFENALNRSKVWYRLMVIKKAKGDTIDRTTLFKQDTDNKMLDQINTERFTIIAQRTFNISASSQGATGASLTGEPTGAAGGQGTKIIKMWIPGRKFGRGGNVIYEDGSSQPKFFDYRICIVSYDWYGTPQDVNAVGRINEIFSKIYFKDA